MAVLDRLISWIRIWIHREPVPKICECVFTIIPSLFCWGKWGAFVMKVMVLPDRIRSGKQLVTRISYTRNSSSFGRFFLSVALVLMFWRISSSCSAISWPVAVISTTAGVSGSPRVTMVDPRCWPLLGWRWSSCSLNFVREAFPAHRSILLHAGPEQQKLSGVHRQAGSNVKS